MDMQLIILEETVEIPLTFICTMLNQLFTSSSQALSSTMFVYGLDMWPEWEAVDLLSSVREP